MRSPHVIFRPQTEEGTVMSIVAEFAARLHMDTPSVKRDSVPTFYRAKSEKLRDIQVVIFDVYGTLINYWNDSFQNDEDKQKELKRAFKRTADFFGFTSTLEKIDPNKPAEQTLNDFYHGLIVMKHEQSMKQGKTFPEVRIEEVWDIILSILARNGYDLENQQKGSRQDFSRIIAYYYNFYSLKRGFFDDVIPALKKLKEQNIRLGILSNAQFYTPIDLTLFLRDQDDELVDFLELFDADLVFYSYEYGVAKPNRMLYEKLYDALYEISVLPAQTVFVGNDLAADVQAAEEIGMKTCLFTGNLGSTFLHELDGKVFPDITFSEFKELPDKISFYTDNKQ